MSVRPAWLVYMAVFSPVGAKQRDPDSDVFNFPMYSSSGAGLGAICVQSLQHRPLSQSSTSTGWIPGVAFKSADLVASTFTCWFVSPALKLSECGLTRPQHRGVFVGLPLALSV